MESLSINMVEVIPYENFREKIKIVKHEIQKGRYIEVWDGYVYSAKRWKC